MTEKIYERDSYCREFTATVLSCTECESGYNVVLDRTAFFPEGGGQAADGGIINGLQVLDVQCEGDAVIHTVAEALPVGAEVKCELDWPLRFSRMQGHAGEHIVSGIVYSMFGYSNIGFHMGESVMSVDFSGTLKKEDIKEVERRANLAVYENAPIFVTFPKKEELTELSYRSKIEIEEGVRIVTIGDIDCCACCAPHPAKTGEIGLIKIIDFYPNKQGTRIEMLAGSDALDDYARLNASNKQLMGLLAAPRDGVFEAVSRLAEQAKALSSENAQLSQKLAFYEITIKEKSGAVYAISEGHSYDELRYCANRLREGGAELCLLLSKADDGYIYVVSSGSRDVREVVKRLNATLCGKGGGKSDYAQGKVSCSRADAEKAIEEILA